MLKDFPIHATAAAIDSIVLANGTKTGWARGRGVVFEDYDVGDFKNVEGLADFGGAKAAWFKDSEGNTLELSQVL